MRIRQCASGSLLGIEGSAARAYFREFSGMFHRDVALQWTFSGRNRRPPRDPVNALLSFAYALLVRDAYLAVACVGLDPYIGFYHTAKYGRPAPALDLAEEFRPLVGDSLVCLLRRVQPAPPAKSAQEDEELRTTAAVLGICVRSLPTGETPTRRRAAASDRRRRGQHHAGRLGTSG